MLEQWIYSGLNLWILVGLVIALFGIALIIYVTGTQDRRQLFPQILFCNCGRGCYPDRDRSFRHRHSEGVAYVDLIYLLDCVFLEI